MNEIFGGRVCTFTSLAFEVFGCRRKPVPYVGSSGRLESGSKLTEEHNVRHICCEENSYRQDSPRFHPKELLKSIGDVLGVGPRDVVGINRAFFQVELGLQNVI